MTAPREAGFVQAWALLLLVLLGSSVQLGMTRAQRLQTTRSLDQGAFVALQVAEAGVAKGRWLVRKGERAGRWTFDVAGQRLDVELRSLSAGRLALKSTAIIQPRSGKSHALRKTIHAVLAFSRADALPRVIERHESRP